MEDYLIREATEADLVAITRLANSYVLEKLTTEEREAGFLTGRFEVPAIQKMVASATSLVAIYQQEIIGFVINSKLPAAAYPPLVQTMAQKFPELRYQNLPLTSFNYFYYGPVLVSKPHRGKGLLVQMFRQTQHLLRHKFDVGIAFIHVQNKNSLDIHTGKLGLKVLGQFRFSNDDYHILIFPVK